MNRAQFKTLEQGRRQLGDPAMRFYAPEAWVVGVFSSVEGPDRWCAAMTHQAVRSARGGPGESVRLQYVYPMPSQEVAAAFEEKLGDQLFREDMRLLLRDDAMANNEPLDAAYEKFLDAVDACRRTSGYPAYQEWDELDEDGDGDTSARAVVTVDAVG